MFACENKGVSCYLNPHQLQSFRDFFENCFWPEMKQAQKNEINFQQRNLVTTTKRQ